MAEAVASSSTAAPARPEAAVLPSKRAEIGYMEEVDLGNEEPASLSSPNANQSQETIASTTTSSLTFRTKRKARSATNKFLAAWHSQEPNPRFGGISNNTLTRILYSFIALGVVAISWYFTFKSILAQLATPSSDLGSAGTGSPMDSSMAVIHISFASAALIMLLFLERMIARARVERKNYKDPEEVLPRYNTYANDSSVEMAGLGPSVSRRGSGNSESRMRPSWLSRSTRLGRSLRDVESDEAAAVPGPPPPAYGNTRGSVLLLSGIAELREGGGGGGRHSTPRRSSSSSSWSLTTPLGSPAAGEDTTRGPVDQDGRE